MRRRQTLWEAVAPLYLERLEGRVLLSGTPNETVGGTIAANQEWFGTVNVTSNLTINAGVTITIDAGTVIKSNQGVGITDNGTMLANGTTLSPVIFTSSNDDSVGISLTNTGTSVGQPGSWRQLDFEAGSSSSVLNNVTIDYAGNYYSDFNGSGYLTAVVINSSNVNFDNVRVLNSQQEAIYVGSGDPAFNNLSVSNAPNQALEVSLAAEPTYSNIIASNTGLNGVEVDGGTISDNRTWNFGGAVAQINGNITIASNASLSIASGQILKFSSGNTLTVDGVLSAVGSGAAPIVFTSFRDDSEGGDTNANGASAGAAGDWGQIIFNAGSDASVLTNVVLDYGGNYYSASNGSGYEPAVEIHASVALNNVQVLNAQQEGINVGAGDPVFNGVTVSNAASQAFEVALAAEPTYTNITTTNDGLNGIEQDGGTISDHRTWNYGGVVAQVNGNINIASAASLTIVPGQILKFYNGNTINVSGTLTAVATAAAPIVLTSYRDDSEGGDTNANGISGGTAGDWGAINFDSGSDASALTNVVID